MLPKIFILYYLIYITCIEGYDEDDYYPKLFVKDGNLIIQPSESANISLQKNGENSFINIGSVDLMKLVNSAQNSIEVVKNIRSQLITVYGPLAKNIHDTISGKGGILERLLQMESTNKTILVFRRAAIVNIRNRVNRLPRRVRNLEIILERNECLSTPCKNGGTCVDTFNNFWCICPKSWKGTDCSLDVDECSNFELTGLGCQNNATCINKPGSFECQCKEGWSGIFCSQTSNNCSTGTNNEICGHGICVQTSIGTNCVCDQGWTSDSRTRMCTVDINECLGSTYPCSSNPYVPCINLQGSFRCGFCPEGFHGDGFQCFDIDECATYNGGCSMTPLVQCINTMGSRMCGPCPPGYMGDGIVCEFKGICSINNGGCHSLATCSDNPTISMTMAICTCRMGYTGSGYGINGCALITQNNTTKNSACDSNPCFKGRCRETLDGYTCLCDPGYIGRNCKSGDFCFSKPCKNGGTCVNDDEKESGYRCTCTAQYTGPECAEPVRDCNRVIENEAGTIIYPESNDTRYIHNSRCEWVIKTDPDKVLYVKFESFHLEHSPDCLFDRLQIHDGTSSADHLIGKFCGNQISTNHTFQSSGNSLFFVFKSDHSVESDGFVFNWNSTYPTCGGVIKNSVHGIIKSPGSPGKYPPNRDCSWIIEANLSNRIQINFFTMQIESHPSCDKDFLAIYDGTVIKDNLLGKYCNSSIPSPLTSSGSTLLIHFHSDNSTTDYGFQLSYSYSEGIPGCGGLYTIDRAEIVLPTVNGKYLSNLRCEFKIRLQKGKRIALRFTKIDLENGDCRSDYAEVYDGETESSGLLGRFCGTKIPPPVYSSSNTMLVVFRSDYSFADTGFSITYTRFCHQIFTESTGIIETPGYPQAYDNDLNCTYLIARPPGNVIMLTFITFHIETHGDYSCSTDSVKVYDGDSPNSRLMAKLCGNRRPREITSTQNFMTVEFNSDYSVRAQGFQINYTSIDAGCGGIYTNQSGAVAMLNPQMIPGGSNINCKWMIMAPPGHMIYVTWMLFEFEDRGDCENTEYLEVYDNNTVSGESYKIGRYCGEKQPPSVNSITNMVTIVYVSNGGHKNSKFSLYYTMIDIQTNCNRNFVTPSGLINFKFERTFSETKCVWIIRLPIGHQIFLNTETFDLNSYCDSEYIEIRDGEYSGITPVGRYCTNNRPPNITSTTNSLSITYHRSSYGRPGQLHMTWSSAASGCGGTLTSSKGQIVSPNYPRPYGKNVECYWQISTNIGSYIQLSFKTFDLQGICDVDYVEIFDSQNDETRSLGKYCSGTHNTKPVVSTSNHMYIKFRSDISDTGNGFLMNYISICNKNLTGFEGVIESPDFPNNYPDDINCTWRISAPKGNKIGITFTHFELQNSKNCKDDYVQIKDGEDDVFHHKYCHTDVTQRYVSKDSEVLVNFRSNDRESLSGFRLEWNVIGCGGILREPSATFSSPNYPKAPPKNRECSWTIIVDIGKAIKLNISEHVLNYSDNCTNDFLAIYNGEDDKSPVLYTACHDNNRNAIIVTSSSHYMFVKFVSSQKFTGKGFTASYDSSLRICGGKFVTTNGVITSPYYPKNYKKIMHCFWDITVLEGHRIRLSFDDFDLNDDGGSCLAEVKLYVGTEAKEENLIKGKLCGNSLSEKIYYSSSNQMLVEFVSSTATTSKGFKASYSLACGTHILAESEGIIKINQFHINLHNYESCTWMIRTKDPNDKLTLTFADVSFLIENGPCSDTKIRVYNGETTTAPLMREICENKAPPTLISESNTITIELTNPSRAINHDFEIVYSVLSTKCGGNLKSEHGTITSPMYPSSYPPKSECTWTLRPSPGNRISTMFVKFDLATSDNCETDYLEIRENDSAGKLLGLYCDQIDSNMIFNTTIWIKFKSDSDGTSPGFVMDYSYMHGGELFGPNGTLASPLYPNTFKKKSEGEFFWKIVVSHGNVIRLNFKELEIFTYEDECDMANNVMIYDGINDKSQVLLTACGYNIPESVESSVNVVYVVLHTDGNPQGSLFLLEWTEVAMSKNVHGVNIAYNENCGSDVITFLPPTVTEKFSSPGYPHGYTNMLKCRWIFETEITHHLTFRLLNIDLDESYECYGDNVQVYGTKAHNDDNWNLIRKFCLSNSSNILVEAGSRMKIEFSSDFMNNRTGFEAEVTPACGGNFTAPSGVLYPVYPNYTKLENGKPFECIWSFTVGTGRRIKFEILNMSIPNENSEICSNYLMFKNGKYIDSSFLGKGKYCGNIIPSDKLETTGSEAYVKFQDSITNRPENPSFVVRFSEISNVCDFKSKLSYIDNTTTITSPNYPDVPDIFTECTWMIMAPVGQRLRLDFVDKFDVTFSKNCEVEYIELYDGGTAYARSMGKFCNKTQDTFKSTGNTLFVKYSTNTVDPKSGFKARVSIDVCGGTITGYEGLIQLPENLAAHNQRTDIECEWIINVMEGYSIAVVLNELYLRGGENCTDAYISFSENVPEAEIASVKTNILCNLNNSQTNYTFQHNSITVKMYAKMGTLRNSETKLRFIYKQSNRICEEKFYSPEGQFSSVNSSRSLCSWLIFVPEGRRITLEMDISSERFNSSGFRHSLKFYSLFEFGEMNKIKYIAHKDGKSIVESLTNKMMVNYFFYNQENYYRKITFKYSSNKPLICPPGFESEEGSITNPSNAHSYICEYKYTYKPDKLNDNYIDNQNKTSLVLKFSQISLSDKSDAYDCGLTISIISVRISGWVPIIEICGNLKEPVTVAIPDPIFYLLIVSDHGNATYKIDYHTNKCGGTYKITDDSFKLEPVVNHFGTIECSWKLLSMEGHKLMVNFTDVKLTGPCREEYIKLKYNAIHTSHICIDKKPISFGRFQDVTLTYYANKLYNETKLDVQIQPYEEACGGYLTYSSAIQSPDFPSNYRNNLTCTWTFKTLITKRVSLIFEKRFALEKSLNCTKDYVEIFDNVDDEWISMGKLCGREMPPVYNSTSNSMKVIFNSDSAITNDGFYARFKTFYGGMLRGSMTPRKIYFTLKTQSEYKILAPLGSFITLEFEHFRLNDRDSNGKCSVSNLTLQQYKHAESVIIYGNNPLYTYCGSDIPKRMSFIDGVIVSLTPARSRTLQDVIMKYAVFPCGGDITNSQQILSYPMGMQRSTISLICKWNITAPPDKIVNLRFQKFVIEGGDWCHTEAVDVYEGHLEDETKRIIKLCGNQTTSLPIIKSKSNKMMVKMTLMSNVKYEGFVADVTFGYGESEGCGKTIPVNETNPFKLKIEDGKLYKPFMDCHWLIEAPESRILRIKFESFHVAPCMNTNQTDSCVCDFIEIRDGVGFFSPLIGKYCGHTLPQEITTSKNHAWVRFVTDGTELSSGIEATITSEIGLCGEQRLDVTKEYHNLTSPGYYSGQVPRNLRCTWILTTTSSYYVYLRITDLDLTPPSNDKFCLNDKLIISSNSMYGDTPSGYTGSNAYTLYGNLPQKSDLFTEYSAYNYAYCGDIKTDLQIMFQSTIYISLWTSANSDRDYKGFQIEYTASDCPFNYTNYFGRINVQRLVENCITFINVPENRTMSLYFINSYVSPPYQLLIKDGPNVDSSILAHIQTTTPLPIFSTSSILRLEIKITNETSNLGYIPTGSFEAMYIANDKENGCGGTVRSPKGVLYSPLYPLPYKKSDKCEWIIETPYETYVEIQFQIFDLGANNCEFDYVELINHDDEVLVKYCPGDNPATREATNNYIKIIQTSSINNKGIGWFLKFIAKPI